MATSLPIDQLRAIMKAEGLQALIVPSEDEHQSEYTPDHAKRLKFISHFTGSAGLGLVGLDESYLWTDGRYYNQAEKQLPAGWKLMKMGLPQTPTTAQFIVQKYDSNNTVGVDSRLLSLTAANAYKDEFKKKGIQLKFTKENLIDKVWGDKPKSAASAHLVRVLPDSYTGQSAKDKIASLQQEIIKKGAHYHVVTALDQIAWLFNIRGSDIEFNPVVISYAIVTPENATLYIDNEKLNQETTNYLTQFSIVKPYQVFFEDLTRLAGDSTKTGWVDQSSSAAVFDVLSSAKILSLESPIVLQKSVKNDTELQGMRNSSVRDAVALVRYFCWLEDQLNKNTVIDEHQASEKLLSFRKTIEHFICPSFATISSSGANAAVIHYKPEEGKCAQIDKNKIYLCDSGGQYIDGTTDVTRTFHFGKPTDQEKEAYTAVLKGHISLDSLVFPQNVTGLQVDAFARAALWQLGLDYRHGTGHGVGHHLCVHEGPQSVSFRPRSGTHPMQQNMTVTNEPGFYEDGSFGIRIENILIVVPKKTKFNFGGSYLGFEHITYVPLDRNLIEKSLLTTQEIDWINNYHKECLEKVGKLLGTDEQTFKWLQNRTQPL